MIALNVVGLRCVRSPAPTAFSPMMLHPQINSSNNYTLKYVDASFYQVARGLVLPFTVLTSYLFLHVRPSLAILLACGVVTLGFLTGVFLDSAYPSLLGLAFGVASSVTTALHAVVIKRALGVLGGGALDLAWYSNLLSAAVLAPLVLIAGEGPAVVALFFGENQREADSLSTLGTFLYGSAITVSDTLERLSLVPTD